VLPRLRLAAMDSRSVLAQFTANFRKLMQAQNLGEANEDFMT
jgi:hypothetical protein